MRKSLLSFIVLLLVFGSEAQDVREFEGRIYYRNNFIVRSDRVDTNQLKETYGITNVYTYKNGNYLWKFDDCMMELELYLHEKALLLNKHPKSKYYISRDIVNEVDSLISYEIKENADTICGYVCKSIKVVTQRVGTNNRLTRILYYNTDIAVNPEHFKNYRGYAHWKVYGITKSVPLKIVMGNEDWPFVIEIVAQKVERTAISDKEFKQNKSWPVKTEDDL